MNSRISAKESRFHHLTFHKFVVFENTLDTIVHRERLIRECNLRI
jgi:hypothetical protein